MRVILNNSEALIVETKGVLMPAAAAALCLLHGGVFFGVVTGLFEAARPGLAWALIALSAVLYAVLFFLAFGPLRDAKRATFYKGRMRVEFERRIPFAGAMRDGWAFTEIDGLEIPPEGRSGACVLRRSDGEVVELFRAKSAREREVFRLLREKFPRQVRVKEVV